MQVKTTFYAGRSLLYCDTCGTHLSETEDGLHHPFKKGLLHPEPIACPFAGRSFEYPHLELKEVAHE